MDRYPQGSQLKLTLDGDELSLGALVNAAKDLHRILVEVGRDVAGDRVQWVVERITHSSPAQIELSARGIERNLGDKIAEEVALGMEMLVDRVEAPRRFSRVALESARRLSDRDQMGLRDVVLETVSRRVVLTEAAVAHIKELHSAKYKEVSTVEGTLEMVSIHRKPRLNLYERIHNAKVTCISDAETVKDVGRKYLGMRVVLTGKVDSDAFGVPLRIRFSEVEPRLSDDQYPGLDRLIGLDPDFPFTAEEYGRHLRGEDDSQ